jgi:hypothetical protein
VVVGEREREIDESESERERVYSRVRERETEREKRVRVRENMKEGGRGCDRGGPLTAPPPPFNNKKCNCIEKDKTMKR